MAAKFNRTRVWPTSRVRKRKEASRSQGAARIIDKSVQVFRMSRTVRRGALTVALALAAGGMVVMGLRPHQLSYNGKNLQEWLMRLELNGDTDREAMEAVQHIGTNAIR